jgi:hypothetical protein
LRRVYYRQPGVWWWSEPTDDWLKAAFLVESVRKPEGPRQRYICKLGEFLEGHEGDPDEQNAFWWSADPLVKSRVSAADWEGIVRALESVIPRPTGPLRPPPPPRPKNWARQLANEIIARARAEIARANEA